MLPVKPYFLRAFYDWIVDNGWTPHLLVDATVEGTVVPREFVKDGQIVLNLAPRAIRDLAMEQAQVSFRTRFAGEPFLVQLPMNSISAIYSQENGESLSFPAEPKAPVVEAAAKPEPAEPGLPDPTDTPPGPKPKKPGLRVVK